MESKAFGIKGRNLIENKCENQIDARMEREARHKMVSPEENETYEKPWKKEKQKKRKHKKIHVPQKPLLLRSSSHRDIRRCLSGFKAEKPGLQGPT